jgi:hypothetical protein
MSARLFFRFGFGVRLHGQFARQAKQRVGQNALERQRHAPGDGAVQLLGGRVQLDKIQGHENTPYKNIVSVPHIMCGALTGVIK